MLSLDEALGAVDAEGRRPAVLVLLSRAMNHSELGLVARLVCELRWHLWSHKTSDGMKYESRSGPPGADGTLQEASAGRLNLPSYVRPCFCGPALGELSSAGDTVNRAG